MNVSPSHSQYTALLIAFSSLSCVAGIMAGKASVEPPLEGETQPAPPSSGAAAYVLVPDTITPSPVAPAEEDVMFIEENGAGTSVALKDLADIKFDAADTTLVAESAGSHLVIRGEHLSLLVPRLRRGTCREVRARPKGTDEGGLSEGCFDPGNPDLPRVTGIRSVEPYAWHVEEKTGAFVADNER